MGCLLHIVEPPIEAENLPLITNTNNIHINSSFIVVPLYNLSITPNSKWKQNGITGAGGNEVGNELNQLNFPDGIYVDDNQTIYIAERSNHRIIQWYRNATSGQIVAGGNGRGNSMNQLAYPRTVVVDKENDSLIICDSGNRRVVLWARGNATEGTTLIYDIDCYGLAMDNKGYLYVVDHMKSEVKRWKMGDANATIVAGGNKIGDDNNQFDNPYYIFVDQNYSVYVSDHSNHRVMNWLQNATEGIVVAGGNGRGDLLIHLSNPMGVFVDQLGHVYATDTRNDRIMRWLKGASEGSVILGGRGSGGGQNQLDGPFGLTFDGEGSIYVSDVYNQRVQKFYIDLN
jgi:hypothetical protein